MQLAICEIVRKMCSPASGFVKHVFCQEGPNKIAAPGFNMFLIRPYAQRFRIFDHRHDYNVYIFFPHISARKLVICEYNDRSMQRQCFAFILILEQ